ncbi:MAG TPA: hypothetical protein PK253_18850 [Spirochaetota bacterium]|nr:hypothetical protein [Spirochaetota bacterium]
MEVTQHECFQFILRDVAIVVPSRCFTYEKQLSRKDTPSVLEISEGCAYCMTAEYPVDAEPVWIETDKIEKIIWIRDSAYP